MAGAMLSAFDRKLLKRELCSFAYSSFSGRQTVRLRSVRFHSVLSPRGCVPNTLITSEPVLLRLITLISAVRPCREIRLRASAHYRLEVIDMQFWDAYYLEKIQEMKARRKAELEEVGRL